MKSIHLLLFIAASSCAVSTHARSMFIDFGDVQPDRGRVTEGPDANGNYWNNVKSSGNNYIYPGTTVDLVDSDNNPTGASILVNVRFMTNGKSAGGLMNPSPELLGDLAVETATEDYLFVEDFQDYNFFTFKNLDKEKAYVFHAFGSRENTTTRIGNYSFRGLNEWDEDHQMSGTGCGDGGYNGNNNHVSVSEPIFPDENGNITFTIKRVQNMMHINAMKIEEIDAERPAPKFALSQTMYIDFGENGVAPNDRWTPTTGADANGHYWNNFIGSTGSGGWVDMIPAGTAVELVNADNEPSGITATLSDYLKTNGGVNGGLMTPSVDDLGDLAIASATGDYVYVELTQPRVSVEFTGVNPEKAYRVHAFGSRATNETGDRWGYFSLNGTTSWRTRQDFAGRSIGGQGIHGNTRNVAVSDYIFPDPSGRLTFTIEIATGLSHLNVLKLEEFDALVEPEKVYTLTSLNIEGSAVGEETGTVAFRSIEPAGMFTGVYAGYLKMVPGTYFFSGIDADGTEVTFGAGEADGQLAVGAGPLTCTQEQIVRVVVDTRKGTVSYQPVNTLEVKGTVAPEGTVLEYAGNGVWKSEVELNKAYTGEYVNRTVYFTINGDDALALRRIARTDGLELVSDGFAGENIRVNNGTYTITADLNEGRFGFDAPIDPYRISVFGSSVANGQGAGNFQGYAYNYGQQLIARAADGLSEYPFYTSGVSIGGNTTVDLLNRYDDMIRDFGTYVLFGLSLGNEGIHGAADPEAVFAQFRDNMLSLIAAARADGKIPAIMNNYTRGDYDERDYEYVRRMNLLIHEWDLPSVNTLGAIDDGAGHWAAGYVSDVAHPNLAGHNEFLYAIPVSMFDALADGKPLPVRDLDGALDLVGKSSIEFEGEGTVHPFTIYLRVKGGDAGRLFSFEHGAKRQYSGSVDVNADGSLTYNSPLKDPVSTASVLSDGEWHTICLTHYHAWGQTFLYVDGELAGNVAERLTPGKFVVGDTETGCTRTLGELIFYRSAMHADEVAALNEGRMLKSSLELYTPMRLDSDGKTLPNTAQTLNAVEYKEDDPSGVGELETEAQLSVIGGQGVLAITSPVDATVNVYCADGRMVAAPELSAGHATVLSLTPGVYIAAGKKAVVY